MVVAKRVVLLTPYVSVVKTGIFDSFMEPTTWDPKHYFPWIASERWLPSGSTYWHSHSDMCECKRVFHPQPSKNSRFLASEDIFFGQFVNRTTIFWGLVGGVERLSTSTSIPCHQSWI